MQAAFDSSTSGVPALKLTATNGADGVDATTDHGIALNGTSDTKIAVAGGTRLGIGVAATATSSGIALRASAVNGNAVNAQSGSAVGILGVSATNIGVQGICQTGYNYGVTGTGANAGVAAFNPNNTNAAYLASQCCAGWFTGNVQVTGKLMKGGGGFAIDHPLDPHNQFLSHSFVESSEMKNLYDGVVHADPQGRATVVLPAWFESLNEDFRYHLCPVGAPAPGLYIAEEISTGKFIIAGAPAGCKISWQITGVRKDAWARANPIPVEEAKSSKERGLFLHPELHGQSPAKSLGTTRHADKSSNERLG